MSTAIKVVNLSKKYLINHEKQARHDTLRDSITHNVHALTNRLRHPFQSSSETTELEEFWALKNIDFEIQQGDRVGIIGRNGAGKSTLLKILSRITSPTTGKITINGRVASLLEVGTGFHPELSGRENIFLNGAILGMRKAEIKKKFDEIVAFAEVEKFLDTPVKRYSSGMYVRLAFAVAAHLEPEVLIVDEVLAVGDMQFQKKCLGKMEEVGTDGRTVLFVSHNMGMIRSLCERSILMDKGSIQCASDTNTVIQKYFSYGNELNSSGEINWNQLDAPGCEDMIFRKMRMIGPDGKIQNEFDANSPICFELIYEIKKYLCGMRIIIKLITTDGIVAFASTDEDIRKNNSLTPGVYLSKCTIPSNLLNNGRYIVNIHSGIPNVKILSMGQDYLSITVRGNHAFGTLRNEKWPGVVAPKLVWSPPLSLD